jgi:hypothetical protein
MSYQSQESCKKKPTPPFQQLYSPLLELLAERRASSYLSHVVSLTRLIQVIGITKSCVLLGKHLNQRVEHHKYMHPMGLT